MSEQALADFWNKLDEDEALKEEFLKAAPAKVNSLAPVVEFASKHGFDFTEDELRQLTEAASQKGGELSDADLEKVAGGLSFGSLKLQPNASSFRMLRSLGNLRAAAGDVSV